MAKKYIENVAIVGASGNIGKFITEGLLKTGKHTVTAITRSESTSELPSGVLVKKVDYNDQSTIIAALQGQDALIITLSVFAAPDTQTKLIEAAAAAKVSWVVPNEWGNDDAKIAKDVFLGGFTKHREHIEALGVSSWTGVVCGFWYEFSLAGGPWRYGFDFKERTVRFNDDGEVKINTTTWPQVGRAVATLLSLKIAPDEEGDEGVTLSRYKNKSAYISSFLASQKDMLESVLRVTGTELKDWKVTKTPVKAIYQEGLKQFQSGDRVGFGKLLYSRSFFPESSGDYGAIKGLDNDVLGLPKEDLDEATRAAVKIAEKGVVY